MVTSPSASIPSVTDLTENSINSFGTLAKLLRASHTASTGPVPKATVVFSDKSSVFSNVTVAVGLEVLPQLTWTSFTIYFDSGCWTCSLTIAS